MPSLVLYGRRGCCLCEGLEERLRQLDLVALDLELQVIDIDAAAVISDLDDWEKIVEEFELCGGTVSEADKKSVLMKKLPLTVSSSMLAGPRRCIDYRR